MVKNVWSKNAGLENTAPSCRHIADHLWMASSYNSPMHNVAVPWIMRCIQGSEDTEVLPNIAAGSTRWTREQQTDRYVNIIKTYECYKVGQKHFLAASLVVDGG